MNEAEILAEVEKRRKRARDLGLDQTVLQLWQRHLKYLREDFDREASDMPESVTRVARTRPRCARGSAEAVELCFVGKSWTFIFEQRGTIMPDGEIFTSGNLRIDMDGKTVLDLYCTSIEDNYEGWEWRPYSVDGFLEGPWVGELKRFAEQVFTLHEERCTRLQQERKREEARELKRKFGF